jgi:nitrile hydratase beta subunit
LTYQSAADVGGTRGFGRIAVERDEPFDAAWEPQSMALMFATAMTEAWNVDRARAVLETLHDYHALSYYQRWVAGLELLTVECGLLYPDEIAAGRALHPSRPVSRVLRADEVPTVLASRPSRLRSANAPARFAVGERVRTRAALADHHTRLPAYARGKVGQIETIHGVHVYPDTNSRGQGEQPHWLYTVVFSNRELWGAEHPKNLEVSIDAWEPYLEKLV